MIMRRNLPPLNPLRIFEVAARHVSFTCAATELGVTQAAVSRQISVLEGALGVCLFQRQHTKLKLTQSGKQYLAAIRPAFDLIDNATAQLQGRTGAPRLRLRAYQTFATYWLIPRLSRFTERHPEIDIELSTSTAPVHFDHEDIDISIQLSDVPAADTTSELLFRDTIAPVCSAKVARLIASGSISDLANVRLIHARYRRRDWADWTAFVGADIPIDGGLCFESSSLSYQAAKAGLGVAMGQLHLVQADLESGALVMPFDRVLQRWHGYYLTHPRRVRSNISVRAFQGWLMEEVRQTREWATAVSAREPDPSLLDADRRLKAIAHLNKPNHQ
jgi:LysR family glycine cleavage system transcriptional activator